MGVIRSVVRSWLAATYFVGFAVLLAWKRPKSRCERAEMLSAFCRSLQRTFKIHFTVEGSFPKRGVLISNHTGYLDILAYAAMNPVVYCAKGEMESWPLIGWITTMVGTVFVDRGSGGAAERAVTGMHAAAEAGIPVVFFPEGTTSSGQQVLEFKTGLLAKSLEANQPITVAFIQYTLDDDNGPDVSVQDDVSFWGVDAQMWTHIFKLVSLSGIHGHVRIAEAPIQFSGEGIDRKQTAAEAREAMLALAPPAVQAASEDVRELSAQLI